MCERTREEGLMGRDHTIFFSPTQMSKQADVEYSLYPGESVMDDIMHIMSLTLSEQYSIYVYRYFLDVYFLDSLLPFHPFFSFF